MKRLFFVMSIAILTILLIACAPSKKRANSSVTTAEQSDPSDVTTSLVPWITSSLPNTQLSVAGYIRPVVYQKDYKSDKGTEVLAVRAMLPEIVLYDEELPAAMIDETISSILSEIDSDISRMGNDYLSADPASFFVTPSYDVFFTLETFTSQTVSFRLKHAITTCDGQYRTYCRYYNISLRTGRVITASQLLEAGADKQFALFIIEKLKAAGYTSLYPDTEAAITRNLEGSWYISDTSLHLHFPMGVIAPASLGEITLDPSNAEIVPLLSGSGKLFIGIS